MVVVNRVMRDVDSGEEQVAQHRFVKFDALFHQYATEVFNNAKVTGIIRRGEYADTEWELDDGTVKNPIKVKFLFDEVAARRANLSNENLQALIENVKDYYLVKLHYFELSNLAGKIRSVIAIIHNDSFFKRVTYSSYDAFYRDFAAACPIAQTDYVNEVIKHRLTSIEPEDDNDARPIGPLNQYLLFLELAEKYYSEAEQKEQCYIRPARLFLKTAPIIPQRAIEFCMISYDCIRIDPVTGKYILMILRDAKKGKPTYSDGYDYILHTPEGDFMTFPFMIPEELAKEYQEYRHLYKERPKEDRLFNTELLEQYHPRGGNVHYSGRFTVENLAQIMNYLYKQIIKKYGYSELTMDELEARTTKSEEYEHYIMDGELLKIRLYDWRHLAAMNLVLRGASPTAVSYLMWHKVSVMDSHYINHVKEYLTAEAKRMYTQLFEQNGCQIQLVKRHSRNENLKNLGDKWVEVEGGRCYSPRYVESGLNEEDRDITDCAMHMVLKHDTDGHLRYFSHEGCCYYRSNESLTTVINREADYIEAMLKSLKDILAQKDIDVDALKNTLIDLKNESDKVFGGELWQTFQR